MLHDSPHWFAVRVKSNRERVTADSLRGKGLEVFYPVHYSSSRRQPRPSPLFSGYVFCRFDPARRLPVLMIPSVVKIVGCGNRPEPIDPAEMERVIALSESRLEVRKHPYLAAGQTVRLVNGPLKGIEGIVVGQGDKTKLVVSITLLQRSIAVELERDWLVRMSAAS